MDERPACFESCSCTCGAIDFTFDRIAGAELKEPVSLDEVCRSGVGWYLDRDTGESGLDGWQTADQGIYILWHKDDYCPHHEYFHMRALYVGKGRIGRRILSHWRSKPTHEEMIVYFTHINLANRMAKYVEQLLLDIYSFPLNKAENTGSKRLCFHLSQFEVD